MLDLDRERLVNSEQGRRGWLREGRRQLAELRRQQARPIAGPRPKRLRESKHRLEEDHQAQTESNAAYPGTINTTDHDSRIMRTTGQPAVQGDSAQAAVNETQIIVAAELSVESGDFGHLEPMIDATIKESRPAAPKPTNHDRLSDTHRDEQQGLSLRTRHLSSEPAGASNVRGRSSRVKDAVRCARD